MHDDTRNDGLAINRTPIFISLALAILLVVGAVFGAKWYFDRVSHQPVAMGPVPAPEAESPECQALMDELPDELLGHDRGEIAEPAPPATAVWQSSEIERISLRCGVEMPLQYSEYSQPVTLGGAQWLRVDDATPESTLTTWYTTDRSPIVAVTADASALGDANDPVSDLPIDQLPQATIPPGPAPLSQLAAGDDQACTPLMQALPEDIAEGYERLDVEDPNTAAWTADGQEPIVVRCGVADPENYQPGERLNQVNDVTWFEDTRLINGSTASTWFALGRENVVAMSVPQFAGNSAVVRVSEVIEETLPAR